MRIEEFEPEKAWWGKREETRYAWKVTFDQLRERAFNLDIQNPNAPESRHEDPDELLARYEKEKAAAAALREELRRVLTEALLQGRG
jgi:type I restriction enzyme M protein